jgi:hypothetical protein
MPCRISSRVPALPSYRSQESPNTDLRFGVLDSTALIPAISSPWTTTQPQSYRQRSRWTRRSERPTT